MRISDWSSDVCSSDLWSYGVNGAYLREPVSYWRDGYDWDAQLSAINGFRHFQTEIDDVPIHFIREPGRGPKPMPIILSHGWPWTFWDLKIGRASCRESVCQYV